MLYKNIDSSQNSHLIKQSSANAYKKAVLTMPTLAYSERQT